MKNKFKTSAQVMADHGKLYGGQPGGPRKPTEGFTRGVITSFIDGVEVHQLRPRGRGSNNTLSRDQKITRLINRLNKPMTDDEYLDALAKKWEREK
jgi:hypothetical protein